jgi:hypothetical protein
VCETVHTRGRIFSMAPVCPPASARRVRRMIRGGLAVRDAMPPVAGQPHPPALHGSCASRGLVRPGRSPGGARPQSASVVRRAGALDGRVCLVQHRDPSGRNQRSAPEGERAMCVPRCLATVGRRLSRRSMIKGAGLATATAAAAVVAPRLHAAEPKSFSRVLDLTHAMGQTRLPHLRRRQQSRDRDARDARQGRL